MSLDFLKSLQPKKKVVAEARSYEDMLLAQLERRADKIGESLDKKDHVAMDVPLLIRVFELVREGAKTDVDVHNITERLLSIKDKGVLTMDDYEHIAGNITKGMVPDKPEDEHKPALKGEDLDINSIRALAGIK
jgi:hypothetical protein